MGSKGNYKHGRNPMRLYNIWKSMRQRCKNPNAMRYDVYGGRGITICDEWDDYAVFREWALQNGYDNTLTIDRIDPNGGYFPSNCRWASQRDQQNNRTNNRIIEANGERHTVAEWGRISGLGGRVITARLSRGWDEKEAISHPLIKGKLKNSERIKKKALF